MLDKVYAMDNNSRAGNAPELKVPQMIDNKRAGRVVVRM